MIFKCGKCGGECGDMRLMEMHEATHTEPLFRVHQWVIFKERLPVRHIGRVSGHFYKLGVSAPFYAILVNRRQNPCADASWLGERNAIPEEDISPHDYESE